MSEAELEEIHLGDQWKPQYDYMLFKKSVNVNYGFEREKMK